MSKGRIIYSAWVRGGVRVDTTSPYRCHPPHPLRLKVHNRNYHRYDVQYIPTPRYSHVCVAHARHNMVCSSPVPVKPCENKMRGSSCGGGGCFGGLFFFVLYLSTSSSSWILPASVHSGTGSGYVTNVPKEEGEDKNAVGTPIMVLLK